MKTFCLFLYIVLCGAPAALDGHGSSTRVGMMASWQIARELLGEKARPPSKKPWLSKTLLMNTAIAALLLAEANVSSLQGLLPDDKYKIVAFGLPILNMLLRMVTSQGLSFKPGMPQGEADK